MLHFHHPAFLLKRIRLIDRFDEDEGCATAEQRHP
jgi:hypothetical protein